MEHSPKPAELASAEVRPLPADALRELLDANSAVVAVKDLLGRYIYVNKRFTDLMGGQDADYLGRTDMQIFPAAVAEQLRANDQRVLTELGHRRGHRRNPERRVTDAAQAQRQADAGYFVQICDRPMSADEFGQLQAALLRAYRWQYIVSGVQEPRFAEILGSLITPAQGEHVATALAPIMA